MSKKRMLNIGGGQEAAPAVPQTSPLVEMTYERAKVCDTPEKKLFILKRLQLDMVCPRCEKPGFVLMSKAGHRQEIACPCGCTITVNFTSAAHNRDWANIFVRVDDRLAEMFQLPPPPSHETQEIHEYVRQASEAAVGNIGFSIEQARAIISDAPRTSVTPDEIEPPEEKRGLASIADPQPEMTRETDLVVIKSLLDRRVCPDCMFKPVAFRRVTGNTTEATCSNCGMGFELN